MANISQVGAKQEVPVTAVPDGAETFLSALGQKFGFSSVGRVDSSKLFNALQNCSKCGKAMTEINAAGGGKQWVCNNYGCAEKE